MNFDYTLISFILYLIITLFIGFLTYRKNKSNDDYFIGGRKLNHWVVAFSERASGESAWLLLGLPGAAYASGFIEIWTAVGCVLGIIFSWFFIAKDLRIETEKYDAITIPDFFANRFDKDDKILRFFAMLIIILFFSIYLAAQFKGAGKVFNVTFEISPETGMIIGAVVIIFYTMMGGFLAVAWTDLVQGIIMIGALVILPIAGIFELNSHGLSLSGELSKAGPNFLSSFGGAAGWGAFAVALSGLSWGLGYMGQPHLLTRFMSIKNPDHIKWGRRIAIAWAIPAFFGAMLIGLVGLALFDKGIIPDKEHVMPLLATTIMPAWVAGIFISGAVAAMMSTADSQLLVISSSVIEDFYHKGLKKNISQKTLLAMSRAITAAVGIIGFAIAYYSNDSLFDLVSIAWAGLGASFGPALLLILKWKNVTKSGVLAGMITGTIVTIAWTQAEFLNSAIHARFVSFFAALIAVVIFSKIVKK